jgi:hypothetical protein
MSNMPAKNRLDGIRVASPNVPDTHVIEAQARCVGRRVAVPLVHFDNLYGAYGSSHSFTSIHIKPFHL